MYVISQNKFYLNDNILNAIKIKKSIYKSCKILRAIDSESAGDLEFVKCL